jgi:hypothetical protein
MTTNEILQFGTGGTVEDGDVLDLATYAALGDRVNGHQPGIANRALANMIARQTAHMAAGLAQFIANRYLGGVLDDGDLDKVEAGLLAAIVAIIEDETPDLTALLAHLTDDTNPHHVLAGQVGFDNTETGLEATNVQAVIEELLAALLSIFSTANSWTAAQVYTPQSLSIDAGAVAWDVRAAPVAVLTLTEDVTGLTLSNAAPGATYELTILQDGTGGRTMAWPAAWRWPGGSPLEVSADAGAEDLLHLSTRDNGGAVVIRATYGRDLGVAS